MGALLPLMRYASRGVNRCAGALATCVGHLVQRREVVDDPEAASLRRDDQVLAVDLRVADHRRRQVLLERLPAAPLSNEMNMPYSVPA
jgi:hypothetical protein